MLLRRGKEAKNGNNNIKFARDTYIENCVIGRNGRRRIPRQRMWSRIVRASEKGAIWHRITNLLIILTYGSNTKKPLLRSAELRPQRKYNPEGRGLHIRSRKSHRLFGHNEQIYTAYYMGGTKRNQRIPENYGRSTHAADESRLHPCSN